MLVLGRKASCGKHSEIWIELPDGQEIVVAVIDTQRGRARIGVTAPPEFHIVRGENRDAVDAQKRVG